MGAADGLIIEAELVLSSSSDVNGGGFLQPQDNNKDPAFLEVLQPSVRRVYLLRLEQLIHPSLEQYLVSYDLPTDLTSQWLILIVNAVRSLCPIGLAPHPIFEALEVDAPDAACAPTHAEEGVAE